MTEPMRSMASEIATLVRRIMQNETGKLPLHVPVFGKNAEAYVSECITTGWVSSVGKFVDRFEEDLASFTETRRAVAVVNGTAALHIAMKLCGVVPGDEVLIPSLTFVATANAVDYCHATPHFVDVEERTMGVDPAALRVYLSEATEIKNETCFNRETGKPIRCLVAMHTFGHPVDLEGILEVCKEFHLPLIEDAAESVGSYYHGKHTGGFGRIGIFSFNGNKTITTGGGGAIVTNDDQIADLAKHLTTTGKTPHPYRYFHDQVAYNYRMPNLNAALGCSQLEDLPALIDDKRKIASQYLDAFNGQEGFRIFAEPDQCKSNYWLNAMILSESLSDQHDQIIQHLHEEGILVRPIWEPLHTLPVFANAPRMNLDTTMNLAKRVINLPSTPKLGDSVE